jgi:hypothetical protein
MWRFRRAVRVSSNQATSVSGPEAQRSLSVAVEKTTWNGWQ